MDRFVFGESIPITHVQPLGRRHVRASGLFHYQAVTSRVRLSNRSAGLHIIARELAVDVVLGLCSMVQTSHPDSWDLDPRILYTSAALLKAG